MAAPKSETGGCPRILTHRAPLVSSIIWIYSYLHIFHGEVSTVVAIYITIVLFRDSLCLNKYRLDADVTDNRQQGE